MKRILPIILLLAFAMAAPAQNAENKVDSKGKKQGYWKKYDEKGILQYEGKFENDVPVGEFKYYHANGKLKSTTYFIEGAHIVRTTLYDQNGKKAAIGKYFDFEKDSIWDYYNSNGTLINTESYKKGVKQGKWQTFSSQTGILLEEKNYTDGQLNGPYCTYFADGKISTRFNYYNGKLHGLTESYYPGEVLYIHGFYKQGSKTGSWDYYDGDGKIRKTVEYRNSQIVKTYLYIYNGSVGQKVNQNLIAYFHKEGNQTRIYTTNGKTMLSTESFETATAFLDFVDFCLINPSYAVSYPSIIKYRKIDSDTIEVVLSLKTEEPVICQGDNAKTVMMLFKTEIPKEGE